MGNCRRFSFGQAALLMLTLVTFGCQQEPVQVQPETKILESISPTVGTTPAVIVVPTATYIPTPATAPDDDPDYPCGPLGMEGPKLDSLRYTLAWTRDNAHLVFNYPALSGESWVGISSGIWIVDATGTRLSMIVDSNPGHQSAYGYHADVSPDSTQVVYSSCEYPKERIVAYQGPERKLHDYEIAVIDLDGARQQRLTANRNLEHFPVWAPNGSYIAFVGNPASQYFSDHDKTVLFIMAADGTDLQPVSPHTQSRIALAPPVWSPDGKHLAYLVNEGQFLPFQRILYSVRLNSGEPIRLAEVATILRYDAYWPTLPSWSPDGKHLAFAIAADEGRSGGIYLVRPDGSGLRQVLEPQEPDWSISQVLWAPDGSEIVAVSDERLYFFKPDGDDLRTLSLSDEHYSNSEMTAAWSPDGGRIALFVVPIYDNDEMRPLIYTISREGTDRRDLVHLDDDGNLVPASPPEDES